MTGGFKVVIAFIAVLIFLFGLQIRNIGGEKNIKMIRLAYILTHIPGSANVSNIYKLEVLKWVQFQIM